MGFHDVQFPLDASYGSQGGDGWNTGIVELDSGSEERVARWSGPKRGYDVAYSVKTRTILRTVLDFFNARNGAANTFRFRDWMDYASTGDGGVPSISGVTLSGAGSGTTALTNADQQIGTGTGTQVDFQLKKTYTSGANTYVRNITKPVSTGFLLSLDSGGGPVNQTSGFSLNTSTGVVTFTTAPGAGVLVRAGFLFDVHARFSDETDKRGIRWRFVEGDQVEADSIVVQEVPDGPLVDDELFKGDGEDLGVIAASFTVDLYKGLVQTWTVNTASLSATMPDASMIPEGFPMLAVQNSGSQSIQIKRSTGTNEFSIAAGGSAVFGLVTQAGVKRWYGFNS